jgi:hypothetical protein
MQWEDYNIKIGGLLQNWGNDEFILFGVTDFSKQLYMVMFFFALIVPSPTVCAKTTGATLKLWRQRAVKQVA